MNLNPRVTAIYICPRAGDPMHEIQEVRAIAGAGLEGDRYATGEGSFNKKKLWWWKIPLIHWVFPKKYKRQVTLINARFFEASGFRHDESRRNIVTRDVELMSLIGKEFKIGTALFRGRMPKGYCDPCSRPSKLSGNAKNFQEVFFDCGGLIAEVLAGGIIKVGDPIVPPKKNY